MRLVVMVRNFQVKTGGIKKEFKSERAMGAGAWGILLTWTPLTSRSITPTPVTEATGVVTSRADNIPSRLRQMVHMAPP